MSTLDWRRFKFFSSIPNTGSLPVEGCMLTPKSDVTSTCSRGLLYISDRARGNDLGGTVQVMNEKFQVNSFIAHTGQVYQLEASNTRDLLGKNI